MKQQQYAQYKGRVYKVIYKGQKEGKTIIKLGFLDGSSEFWAKQGEPVIACDPPRRRGRPCGYPGCDGVQFCDECSD